MSTSSLWLEREREAIIRFENTEDAEKTYSTYVLLSTVEWVEQIVLY
jgi:hypothetical protein